MESSYKFHKQPEEEYQLTIGGNFPGEGGRRTKFRGGGGMENTPPLTYGLRSTRWHSISDVGIERGLGNVECWQMKSTQSVRAEAGRGKQHIELW